MSLSSDPRVTRLADPALRASLSEFVRSRVPPDDVDDIVQSTLAEALAAEVAPAAEDEVTAWVHGIARHKVIDWYRRGRRELPQDPLVTETVAAADSAPQSARDLLRWAKNELPAGHTHARTLEWMLREGAGEKLESIAADEDLPAPQVRQRVSRLRKHFRARWAAQAAVLAALLLLAAFFAWRRKPQEQIAPLETPFPPLPSTPAPLMPTPEERAAELRRDAFEKCDARHWQECVDELDEAQRVDPAGDSSPAVRERRKAALNALMPPAPVPKPSSTSAPGPRKLPPRKSGPESTNPSSSDSLK